MTDFQLSVLQQDSEELREYITELTAKGKDALVTKLSKVRVFRIKNCCSYLTYGGCNSGQLRLTTTIRK